MATHDGPGRFGKDNGPTCARDFVLDRLSEADSPMSPVELATEYGCTNGHVRNLLTDLREEGLVERPRHGKYRIGDDESDGKDSQGDSEASVESTGNGTNGGDTEVEANPAGGEARSEAPDTADRFGREIDPATALLVATALFALFVLVGAVLSEEDDGGEPAESDQDESVEETDEPETSLIG